MIICSPGVEHILEFKITSNLNCNTGKLCIIHIISKACHASGLVLNSTDKRKPIPRNEIFPDDVNFANTKNGWMTADFMEEMRGRGTFGKDALQLHLTHKNVRTCAFRGHLTDDVEVKLERKNCRLDCNSRWHDQPKSTNRRYGS